VARLTITQAGEYEIFASGDFNTTYSSDVEVGCTLTDSSGTAYNYGEATLPAGTGHESISLIIGDDFSAGEQVNLTCWWSGSGSPTVFLNNAVISAVQASSIVTSKLTVS
jgi:hypothetical protein